MPNGDFQDARTRVQDAAGELYQLAALMMGNESEAVELVEAAVAQIRIDPCAEADASVREAGRALVSTAVARLSKEDPSAFEAPLFLGSAAGPCIEQDDLASAGFTPAQLTRLLSGPERGRLRDWLNHLSVVQRAIFVERAILGWDNATAAASFNDSASRKWQPGQVGELFRQALCSLASSIVHAATAKA